MAHPLVNVVTHPANRAPGRTAGYDLDWDRFFAAARDTGTAVEVDGAPGHLDLDGHLARRAVETGATVVVDSDGHFAERLGRQMRMGVGTAARGGVEAGSVLNARGLDGVRAFVEAKRRRAR
jgi:DNA polymerase (family 10)